MLKKFRQYIMKASDNEIEEMKMNEMETNRTPMTTPMVGKNLLNT